MWPAAILHMMLFALFLTFPPFQSALDERHKNFHQGLNPILMALEWDTIQAQHEVCWVPTKEDF